MANRRLSKGLLRLGKTSRKESGWSVLTVNEGTEKRIEKGEVVIERIDETGAAVLEGKIWRFLKGLLRLFGIRFPIMLDGMARNCLPRFFWIESFRIRNHSMLLKMPCV